MSSSHTPSTGGSGRRSRAPNGEGEDQSRRANPHNSFQAGGLARQSTAPNEETWGHSPNVPSSSAPYQPPPNNSFPDNAYSSSGVHHYSDSSIRQRIPLTPTERYQQAQYVHSMPNQNPPSNRVHQYHSHQYSNPVSNNLQSPPLDASYNMPYRRERPPEATNIQRETFDPPTGSRLVSMNQVPAYNTVAAASHYEMRASREQVTDSFQPSQPWSAVHQPESTGHHYIPRSSASMSTLSSLTPSPPRQSYQQPLGEDYTHQPVSPRQYRQPSLQDAENFEEVSGSNTRVLACLYCPSTFTGIWAPGNLARHVNHKHPGGSIDADGALYYCDATGCDSKFSRNDALLKHVRDKHPQLGVKPAIKRKLSGSPPSTTE